MAVRSRRKAREAAMRCLYEIDLGDNNPADALESAVIDSGLEDDHRAFASKLVQGFLDNRSEIDNGLAKLIRDFDFDRLAPIDRNLLRIAAYELLFEPSIPPKVTINEAVEIAKRYSTTESGRFVNGVLGRFILDTPKAHWDPAKAPPEEFEEVFVEADEAPKEEIVEPDSEEAKAGKKFGAWTVREH